MTAHGNEFWSEVQQGIMLNGIFSGTHPHLLVIKTFAV
jgi:hypothetical protein